MKGIIETAMSVYTDEKERAAFKGGCEFITNIVLKKMDELFNDEWLSDAEILNKLHEFIRK